MMGIASFDKLQAITHPATRPELAAEVARGLDNDTLRQTGGVVRNRLGQIVAHLYQQGEAPERSAVSWGPEISSSLSGVRDLVTASGVLSALNLGVSAVGFAVLAKKISQVNASLVVLESSIQSGFRDLAGRSDRIESRLAGLTTLTATGFAGLDSSLGRLQRQIDWTVISRMLASAESLADIANGRPDGIGTGVGEHAEALRSIRTYLSGAIADLLEQQPASTANVAGLLRARLLTVALAQAYALEGAAWRMAGASDVAARVTAAGAVETQRRFRDVCLPLLGGDPRVLGWDVAVSMPAASATTRLTTARLFTAHEMDTTALTVALRARFAAYLGEDAARAKAFIQDPAEVDRRVRAALELAGPLAHAADALAGLSLEYKHLAVNQVQYAQWEQTQLPEGQSPRLVIRVPAKTEQS